jgi:hypothetical protein
MEASQRQSRTLDTIRYFDAMDRSLTAAEVWRWQVRFGEASENEQDRDRNERIALRQILDDLDTLLRRGVISFRDGWYFLTESEQRFSKRLDSVRASNEKLRRMAHWASVLRYIPFVRLLVATGGLATKTSGKESDWDVLIIVQAGRIWTARTIATVVLHLLGKRRYGNVERDRFCLNHFITDDFLEMEPRDVFSAKECVVAVPLGNHEFFLQFWKHNLWLRSFLPQWEISRARHIRTPKESRFGKAVQRGLEVLLDWRWLERWLESWQKPKILRNPKSSGKNSYIVANRQSLVFWPNPNGPKVFARFKRLSRTSKNVI